MNDSEIDRALYGDESDNFNRLISMIESAVSLATEMDGVLNHYEYEAHYKMLPAIREMKRALSDVQRARKSYESELG